MLSLVQGRIGLFEQAHGATLFLDEIGDMDLAAQAKVLRVLQSGELSRVGSEHTIVVDVRVLAATNKDLAKAVADGSFREDLFFRLNVFPLTVPTLDGTVMDVSSSGARFRVEGEVTHDLRNLQIVDACKISLADDFVLRTGIQLVGLIDDQESNTRFLRGQFIHMKREQEERLENYIEQEVEAQEEAMDASDSG